MNNDGHFSYKYNDFVTYLVVCLVAGLLGILTGLFTALCGYVLLEITYLRSEHLFYFLASMPIVASLLIWVRNRFMPRNVLSDVFRICCLGTKIEHIPFRYMPFIMIGTWTSHVVGASVGREGVAMQIGATISDAFTKRIKALYTFKEFDRIRKTLLVCGFAAGFAGLFHVPFAAIVFAFELLIVNDLFLFAIIPTFLSSFVSFGISTLVGLKKFEVDFSGVALPIFSTSVILKLVFLGVLFGLIGFLFSALLKNLRRFVEIILPNSLFRIFISSIFLAPLLLFTFQGRYTGLGINFINDVFFSSNPHIYWFDWCLKLLFTVLCLAAGFFGGEVTPLFSIGVCFGFWIGSIVGISPVLCAALGFVAVFAAATNTFLGASILAWEIFGFHVFVFAIFVTFFAYLVNFNYSIYSNLFIRDKDSLGFRKFFKLGI
ncbi:chloride channel protein [Actinomyces sp. zg-332]|uniref:chloride channel protein n=1 Tax=Actinomyces sp. zg-332 TaxID=2708340 RepID=UPI00141F9C56|nr:chloride channel protein [Actinomyces sp. zg-332]QPK94127.1 chloride channel protein [Actinomyces sp. zg-332]